MKVVDTVLLLLFYSMRYLVRVLPLRYTLRTGRLCGALLSSRFKRDRRIALTQLAFVIKAMNEGRLSQLRDDAVLRRDEFLPEHTLHKRTDLEQLVTEVFAHVGQTSVESMLISKLIQRDKKSKDEFRYISVVGSELVKEVISSGKAAINLSGHIGCFELLAATIVEMGAKVSVMAREANYPLLSSVSKELRASYGIETIWRDDAASARKLMTALRTGHIVSSLIDQDVNLKNVFQPFFGIPAASPVAPIRLAIKRDIPIFSSFIVRIDDVHHRIIVESINYDKEDPNAPDYILAVFNRRLEDLICRFPEQWIWWHRRWRRRPGFDYLLHPERLRSTNDYLAWLEQGSSDAPAQRA